MNLNTIIADMKNGAFYLLFVLTLACVYSCDASKQVSYNDVTLRKNEPIVRISNLFTPDKHVQLKDCGASSIISDADRVIFIEDKVFVFDDAADVIVCNDWAGNMLASTMKYKGHGKHEYVQLSDMAYDEESGHIYVLCDTPSEIMVFDTLLNIIDVKQLNCQPTEMCVLNDNLILLCRDYSLDNFEVLSLHKKILDSPPLVILSSPMVNKRVMGMGRCLTVTDDECWVALPFNSSIFRTDGKEIKEEYRIDFGEEWYEDNNSSKPLEFIGKNMERIWSISNIQKCNDYLWFNTNSDLLYCLDTKTKECTSYDIIHDSIPFASQLIIPQQGMQDKISFHIMSGFIRSYLRNSKEHKEMQNRQAYILAKGNEREKNALIMTWKIK